MSIFSWIKDKLRTNIDPNTGKRTYKVTEKEITTLTDTQKFASKQIALYYVYENISDNIDDYNSTDLTPLYVACTHEEAVAACLRLTYVRNIEHYFLWCAIRNLHPGIADPSWWQYLEDTRDGFNNVLYEDFRVAVAFQTIGDLISAYRMLTESSVTILGLPTETSGETIDFITRAETGKDENGKTYLKSIRDTETKSSKNPRVSPLFSVLRCDNVGEFFGKITLLNLEDFTGDTETGMPGCKQLWEQTATDKNFKELSPETRAVFAEALKTNNTLLKEYRERLK